MRVEFHLPGVEWIVADPTSTDGEDTEGNYAYFFGQVYDGRNFVSMDAGYVHIRNYITWGLLQVPNWYWNGGAEFVSREGYSRLQPLSTVKATPSSSQVTVDVEDTPTEGSMVIESSTDLKTWQAELTEPATGGNKTFILPKRGNTAFYRSRIVLN